MFGRFTPRARQVPVIAQEEARAFRHDHIGTEHLLLGLLLEEDGLAAKALDSLGVSVENVRARIDVVAGRGDASPTGQIPFTPRAKKVLELALREALSLGHNYIGTEHILLGIAQEGEGVAMRILRDADLDGEAVRQAVMDLLRPRMGRPRPGRAQLFLRRPSIRFISQAREAALREGRYDLARKLLELEIEEREHAKGEPSTGKPEAGAA